MSRTIGPYHNIVVIIHNYDVLMARHETTSTRERLLDAGFELFTERGYAGTTVGQIEQAAGLAPRSGALYQYFSGKDDLLRAAIERENEALGGLEAVLDMLPLGDLRAELTLLARWNLSSIRQRARLRRFVVREADHLPQDLVDRLYERLVAEPYALVTAWIRSRIEATGRDPNSVDVDAIALILIEPMSSYLELRALFGRTPGDVDDERFLAAWVEFALAVAAPYLDAT